VDSKSATFGMAMLVRAAVKLRSEGKSAAEIAETVSALSERVVLIAYIPTLKYLVRGGRLSATAGVIGGVLNIFPLVSMQEGVLKSIGKARGKSAACKEIAKMVQAIGIDKSHGMLFGHAAAREDMEKLMAQLAGSTEGCEINTCELGAVIGTHTGPGAVGLAFIR
jgi:DegV family protein with EDD domain